MVGTVPDVLAKIVDHKKHEIATLLRHRARLEKLAADSISTRRDFHAALTAGKPAIIAESKKASPSKGVLNPNYDAARITATYAQAGAAAVSVLTDQRFFQGSLADLESARQAIAIPILRKDFTLDEIQVHEAAAHGADAILLIAAILTTADMRALRELASQLKLASLVEVHNHDELRSAIDSGAGIIGVNNRNLHNFHVTLDTSIDLAQHMPPRAVRVSESGIHSPDDVRRLLDAGYHAFLVGEHLMKSGDPAGSLKALMLR